MNVNAFADVYTVGPADDCTYHTIVDAVAVTAAAGGSNEIHVQVFPNSPHLEDAIVIDNQNLTIIAGYQNCNDATPVMQDIVIGNTSGSTIISITGKSNVLLQKFGIEGQANNNGSGIIFAGNGSLTLNNTFVSSNNGGPGGGINMSAKGGAATLNLENASGVAENKATGDGGGILLDGTQGPVTLYIDAATDINNNNASTNGGGIAMHGTAIAFVAATVSGNTAANDGGGIYITDIGSLSTDSTALIDSNIAGNNGGGIALVGPAAAYVTSVVSNNFATNGGGISAVSATTGGPRVSLYSSNSNSQASLYLNGASSAGGGIYLAASGQGQNPSTFCAQDFNINGNSAGNGAAIWSLLADSQQSPTIVLNSNSQSCAPVGAQYPPVSCPDGAPCGEIDGNVNGQVSESGYVIKVSPTGTGSAILINNDSLVAARVEARGNNAGSFISISTAVPSAFHTYAQFSDCLIADNSLSDSASQPGYIADVSGTDAPMFEADSCTFANNTVNSLIRTGTTVHGQTPGTFKVTDSIVNSSGSPIISGVAGSSSASYVLADKLAPFGTGSGIDTSTITIGFPTFVDATNTDLTRRDYHLTISSQGVDVAPPSLSLSTDLDGRLRSVDQPSVNGTGGDYMDLGAYEIPYSCSIYSDTIFCDGFEQPIEP